MLTLKLQLQPQLLQIATQWSQKVSSYDPILPKCALLILQSQELL